MITYKTVKDYEGLYSLHDSGDVWSHKSQKFLKPSPNPQGYLYVILSKDGKQSTKTIHRLLAEAFIPNLDNKPCINHKNGDKTDNSLDNLEWCNHSENNQHAWDIGLRKGTDKQVETMRKTGIKYGKKNGIKHRSKPVLCIETNQTFYSAREAARKLGLSHGNISKVIAGKQKTTGKLTFKYLDKGIKR